MSQDRDVAGHLPHLWLRPLTAVMIRSYTELCVRVDEEMSCVVVTMEGTPSPVLLGVTIAGAENLCTAIATGLVDLASRRQSRTGDKTAVVTNG
ncbi:MAG: hypothetical protein ACRDRS_13710 [Pseudonocardiaceae bacterium]